MLFLFDRSSYSTDELVTLEAAALQGPSLILASSRALSDADLSRIQRLGGSDKGAPLATAGRFGLGLNALYHVTDCPQIFARGLALVVFDPLHKMLGGKDGRGYSLDTLARHFPSLLEPFAEVAKDFPNVFRLPLRGRL